MTLKREELTALVKMAIMMTLADDVDKDEEYKVIGVTLNAFGVLPEHCDIICGVAQDMDVSIAVNILSNMSIDQKKFASGFLAAIMAADDELTDEEIQLWVDITMSCGFPRMEFVEALEFWENN